MQEFRERQEFWERFEVDPRLPENQALRASDADREVVRTQLAEAYATGRVTREEYDERLAGVLGAVTLADLPPLVADLVPHTSASGSRTPAFLNQRDVAQRAEDKWRRKVREDVSALVFVSVLLWSIWLFTEQSFPWPLFPMLAVGLNAANTVLNRKEIVTKEAARLERKQRKQLERPDKEEGA